MENSRHLERVESAEGKKVRDHLIGAARDNGYHMRCSDRSFVPHVQFRRDKGERPYPFSLSLNRIVPTFYVRRPSKELQRRLLKEYDGAHMVQGTEVKIPIPDIATARRISAQIL